MRFSPVSLLRASTIFVACGLTVPAMAEVPRVVTDMGVTGSLVQQVMGDLGQPVVLLEQGGDPHDYQLRPSQARALQDTDLLIWVGPALSPWMERARDSIGAQATSVELLSLPGTRLIQHDAHDDDHAAHDDQDHHAGDDHDHDHGPTDPHAWLAPDNARTWLTAIAEELAARDPEHAATYRANATAAGAEIAATRDRIAAQLAPFQGRHIAVQHDAYRYFTTSFGLADAIAIALSDATPPSAARLREIRDALVAEGVSCAFPEQNHDDRLMRAAIEGSAIRLGAPLDPEGSLAQPGAALYLDMMQGMATAIAGCMEK